MNVRAKKGDKMDSNQLFKYVYAKYGLKFKPAVPGSTSVYVLMSPVDSGYFAILSRGQGQSILDLKCGAMAALIRDLPGFTDPMKIKAADWVGAILEKVSEDSLKKALDFAFKLAMNGDEVNIAQNQYFYIAPDKVDDRYQAQAIKPSENLRKKHNNSLVPDRIRKMLEIYDYSILPSRGRAKNFYQQARMMADYDDDYPEFFAFKRFYPTYHDMNTGQLRSYFTWRSKIRQHVFEKTSTSYAFVYIYELLNNIGVDDAQDGYEKLLEFEEKYVRQFDISIDVYLQDWLKDYVLYYDLDEKIIKQRFASEIKRDHDYEVLHHPEKFTAQGLAAVFAKKTTYWNSSKVINKNEKLFVQLLRYVWLELLDAKKYGIAYYSAFVGKPDIIEKPIFAGSVFYLRKQQVADHQIDAVRKYHFYQGKWQIHCDQQISRQRVNLNNFLHELDRVARTEFKLGRSIKPRFIDQAVLKAIDAGIAEYRIQEKKAQIDQIKIDFSDLDQIRANASKTRDSLLTDEEKQLEQAEAQEEVEKQADETVKVDNDYGLDENEMFFLTALLMQQPWQTYLKQHHLMASILMDNINEKLFDEFGDVVLENNEQDQPQVITDYVDDLKDMFLKG